MLVNILFPFDERLLSNYRRKIYSKEDKRRLSLCAAFIFVVSILFAVEGTQSFFAKLLIASPAIACSAIAILLLLFSNDEKKEFKGITLFTLSISSFAMAICLTLNSDIEDASSAIAKMLFAAPAFVILLIIGYRIHFKYQMKNGSMFEKIPWNNSYSALMIVVALSIAKCCPMNTVVVIAWILWVFLHFVLSSNVLSYKLFCRSIDIEKGKLDM